MRLIRGLALAGVALALAACPAMGPSQLQLTPQQQVYDLTGKMDATLVAIRAYTSQETCSETVVTFCAEPDVVEHIWKTVNPLLAALREAQTIVRTTPGSPEIASYALQIRRGLGRLTTYLVKEGVVDG